jgi:hypothetical protein
MLSHNREHVAKDAFNEHIDEFYIPFCRAALKAMMVLGFVPWKTRRLKNKEFVPEVLPMGTFSWYTELSKNSKRPNRESSMVCYRINPTGGHFKEDDVNIYVHTIPALDIMNHSMLYATVVSPLAHILTEYKALRQGQLRRAHADAWNTTAKIITQFDPKLRVEDNPTQYLMDFVHEDYFAPPSGGESMYPPFEAHNVWQREQIIRRQFESNPSVHHPEVFALPRDHTVAAQTRLDPCEDIHFLNDKYKRDVCSLLGVPYEMIQGKDSSGLGNDNVKKTLASGRIFSTNMQDYCKHLQRLLKTVYKEIYSDDSSVEFILVPMPRLEIECIADLKILHEIGALTPDMSMQMSQTLLGENNMKKNSSSNSNIKLNTDNNNNNNNNNNPKKQRVE